MGIYRQTDKPNQFYNTVCVISTANAGVVYIVVMPCIVTNHEVCTGLGGESAHILITA